MKNIKCSFHKGNIRTFEGNPIDGSAHGDDRMFEGYPRFADSVFKISNSARSAFVPAGLGH